jgi:hypothetical protein
VSEEVTEWGSPSAETGKFKALCQNRCGTIKIAPCSKDLSAEQRPKFCSLSTAIVSTEAKKFLIDLSYSPVFLFV